MTILNKSQVSAIDTIPESLRHFEAIVNSKVWLHPVAILELSTCMCYGACISVSHCKVFVEIYAGAIEALVQALVDFEHLLLCLVCGVVNKA